MNHAAKQLTSVLQSSDQAPRQRKAPLARVMRGAWMSLLIPIICSMLLLVGLYRLPVQRTEDIGSQPTAVNGLYTPERNERFSYAYTTGDAFLKLPQSGAGQFVLTLRLGGPNGNVPVSTHLEAPSFGADLGRLEGIRVYHLLAPTGADGDLQFHIRSTTARIGGDSRHLGALLDWIGIRSLGILTPPVSLLLSTPIILLLVWIVITQLGMGDRRRLGLVLLCGAALCASYAGTRGRGAFQPGWLIGAGMFPIVVIGLSRFDGWPTTPLRGVAALFLVWRAALWLVGGLGLWYSNTVYEFGRALASGGAVAERKQFLWQVLGSSWLHWDSAYYQGIAVDGYKFLEQDWPNIAFFPLYPLLIRLLLPITMGNTVIAALLVSHLALFGALLLFYDLVARDFGSKVAYRSLVLLLIFPTAVYFVAGYTESLALVLAIAVLWAVRRQRWWLAGAAGCLLALTRLPGVMAGPLIAYAYLQHYGWRWRAIRPAFLAVLLPPAGLALFMLFQWWRFGTPIAFLIAQERWDQHLSPPWVMPKLWLDFFGDATDWPIMLFQAVIWIAFIGLTVFTLLRLPSLYGLTMLLLLLPPYLNNRAHSLPRYVLLGFPAFVLLTISTQRTWVRGLVIGTLLLPFVIAVLLFVNGFWIA